jgi:hypothetical protein
MTFSNEEWIGSAQSIGQDHSCISSLQLYEPLRFHREEEHAERTIEHNSLHLGHRTSTLSISTEPVIVSPLSYTATFDARTMVEVTTKCPKKMSKEKAKEVWANRNETCKRHKKQKKKV